MLGAIAAKKLYSVKTINLLHIIYPQSTLIEQIVCKK